MNRDSLLLSLVLIFSIPAIISAETARKTFTYTENFESGGLNGWESYPLWQDTAFDPWIRPNTIVPGDPNRCLEQKVNAFWHADTYGGMQKRLDMFLTPDMKIGLRYYIASATPAEYVKIRLAAGPDGVLEYLVRTPSLNSWERIDLDYAAIVRENPISAAGGSMRIYGIAVLVKFPMANPRMNYYYGIDDVSINGQGPAAFRFTEPRMHRLREWKPAIPDRHYHTGDTFILKGEWPIDADRVTLGMAPFPDSARTVLNAVLVRTGGNWSLQPFALDWSTGMYRGALRAFKGNDLLAEDCFMIYVAPKGIGKRHPRIWFDAEKKRVLTGKLTSGRFRPVGDDIRAMATDTREKLPLDRVVYTFDQLNPDTFLEGQLYTAWFTPLAEWQEAVYRNALAYCFFGDRTAGVYAKDVLLKVSGFPSWQHPWTVKMGWYSYYAVSETGKYFALAYDMLYDLMDDRERGEVRRALLEKVVIPCHKGYVEQNRIASNTSNWIAMLVGGSLMCMAAIYDDNPDETPLEPYFTGAVMKYADMIEKSVDPTGAYGEGGYFNVTFRAWNDNLPAIENLFGIDLSKKIRGVWNEVLWSSILPVKRQFQTGDSGGYGIPGGQWFVEKFRDPVLGWAYDHLKGPDSFMDVLYDTDSSQKKSPFDMEPVRCFRNTGITVFKSGWKKDDFVFVMQTGSFYNHQHYHQGNFFLADRGDVFVDRRKGSHYWYYSYDPLYLPWFIQPTGYSTILIDGNRQSQRTGDPIGYIPGFEDRAFIHQFLNGSDAAFVSGDMTRIYWGKAKSLRRNVLYLKPRTVLMLDTVVPDGRDIDATLLYQAVRLDDVTADLADSRIKKGGGTLHILHLNPEYPKVAVEEAPHYIFTVKDTSTPLEREGMLTLTARTEGKPLVIANLLTVTPDGAPNVRTERRGGSVSGTTGGKPFAFSTQPGSRYDALGVTTDALAMTGDGSRLFCALATVVEKNGKPLIRVSSPSTFEISPSFVKLCLSEKSTVEIGVSGRQPALRMNGREVKTTYDRSAGTVKLDLDAGEWEIEIVRR